jgi:hypothetical protein
MKYSQERLGYNKSQSVASAVTIWIIVVTNGLNITLLVNVPTRDVN